jgi:nitrate reductase NapE component
MIKTQNVKRNALPVGMMLIILMALVQATRYARSFSLNEALQGGMTGDAGIDTVLQWLGLGGGILMGMGVSFGIAYVAIRYRGLKATTKTAKESILITRFILIAILCVSPFVLVPLAGAFVTLGWWHQIILMAIPDALTAALAFSDSSIASATQSGAQSDAMRRSPTHSATEVRKSATHSARSATQSDALWPRKCDFCDEQIASPNAKGAHMKKHHPEKCKVHKMVIVDATLQTQKAEKTK